MRFTLAVFLLLALISSVEVASAQQIRSEDYNSKLRLAQAYEESHDVNDAVRLYSELHAANPADQAVFEGLTRGLLFLKRYEEAERIVQERMKTDNTTDVLLLYARLEARVSKRPEALAAFKSAVESIHAKSCAQLFPVVYAMIDVSYNQDALDLLDKMRSLGGDERDLCTSQIAGLYLRLGEEDRASREFIAMLGTGDGNVLSIEQRLAQYMTDSVSRSAVLGSLQKELLKVAQTAPVLRLLAWLYGEEKDYAKALDATLKLDDLGDKGNRNSQGFELLQFADRARNEGALATAVRAYDEAIKRMKSGDNARQNYYIAQAELGAMKTRERYLATQPPSPQADSELAARYENYAKEEPAELALDAYVRAGDIAFHHLFDIGRATKDYESALNNSRSISDLVRDASFGLVDLAYASENFALAQTRLQAIDQMIRIRRGGNEREMQDRLLYEEALGDYFQQRFDTAQSKLSIVSQDVASDYANDAIQLSGLLFENNTPGNLSALTVYSKAALAETAHKFEEARAGYQSIVESMPSAPLADDAALRVAEMQVKLGKPSDAVATLETMQEKMLTSPLIDQAAFREAEIVEKQLHDKQRAQKLYEDFLARYPTSILTADARERARKLRGDAF